VEGLPACAVLTARLRSCGACEERSWVPAAPSIVRKPPLGHNRACASCEHGLCSRQHRRRQVTQRRCQRARCPPERSDVRSPARPSHRVSSGSGARRSAACTRRPVARAPRPRRSAPGCQRAPRATPACTRAAGFGQPDARTGHVVVQLRTSSAVDLLRYACSPRIIPISTSQINSNRRAHHPNPHSS